MALERIILIHIYFHVSFHLDVNECNDKNGGCDQTCENKNGSFACKCASGYNLHSDGFECEGGWSDEEMLITLRPLLVWSVGFVRELRFFR